MELKLKIDQQYIIKNGLEFNFPINRRGGLFDMFGMAGDEQSLNPNKTMYQSSRLYERAIITVRDVQPLSDVFTRVLFSFVLNKRNTASLNTYQAVGLPHFIVYDDSKLVINDEIKESLFTASYRNFLYSHTKFKECIVEYDPILAHKISAADQMILNAGRVIQKCNNKIQKIYDEYFKKKKEYDSYDKLLEKVVGSEVLEKQTHTDFFKEPESAVNNEQGQQPQSTDNGKEPQ